MPESAINSAIEKALLDAAIALAEEQSPELEIALPNQPPGLFTKPAAFKTSQWLRATVLPAQAVHTGIAFDAPVQHYGILQIDVIQGVGGGTLPIQRTVAAIREFFAMGTTFTEGDFVVRVLQHSLRAVTEGPLMNDDDGWVKIPVSIPWVCYE